jgi:hypothetical protein
MLKVQSNFVFKAGYKIDKKSFLSVGEYARFLIEERTNKSLDIDERPFKKYTKQYLKWRQAKGHGSKPDLHVTDKMFGAFIYKLKREDKLVLYFNRSEEKKKAHGNNRKRPFVGIAANTRTYKRLMRFTKRNLIVIKLGV